MNTRLRVILNYLFLILIFVWQSLRLTIFEGIDGKGRLNILLAMAIFTINILSSRKFGKSLYSKTSILKFWFFWFLYATVNSIVQFNSESLPLFTFLGQVLFVPFVVMSTIANLPKVEIKKSLLYMQYLVYASFLIIIGFVKNIDGRLTLDLFNTNELSLIVLLLVAILSFRYIRNDINNLYFFLLMILPTYYVVFAGSRMAFGSYSILVIGIFVSFKERLGIKLMLKYFFVLIMFLSVTFYILEYTILGERLMGTTEQVDSSVNNPAEGTIFESFGDRGVYYIISWKIFIENSVWGIGLKNFINYWPTVNHVELMVQLSELGIIGMLIYSIFNFLILKKILQRQRKKIEKEKPELKYLLFVWGSILFSATVLFLYNSIAIAAMYGLIILYLEPVNNGRKIYYR